MTERKKTKKLAKLTDAENHAWEKAFQYHMEQWNNETLADNFTWQDLKKEFPRLKEFDGALPD